MSLNVLEKFCSIAQTLSWADRVRLVSGGPLLARRNLFTARENQKKHSASAFEFEYHEVIQLELWD